MQPHTTGVRTPRPPKPERRVDMVSSILIPLLFSMKMGGLLVVLRSNIKAMEAVSKSKG